MREKTPKGWKRIETGVVKKGDKVFDKYEHKWLYYDKWEIGDKIGDEPCIRKSKVVYKVDKPWKIITVSIT